MRKALAVFLFWVLASLCIYILIGFKLRTFYMNDWSPDYVNAFLAASVLLWIYMIAVGVKYLYK